ILDSLHKIGYLHAHYQNLKKKNDSTYVSHIFIGNKINVALIHTKPSTWPKEIKNTLPLDKYNRLILPIEKLDVQLINLHNKWENHGYSFVSVKLENLSIKKDTLLSSLSITRNETRKIDSIEVKGYSEFPKKILRHRFGLKENNLLSKDKITYVSETIEALGVAREIRSPEVLYEKE